MFSGSYSLKFFKRLNVYKNSTDNCSFDPNTLIGRSYNWNFCSKVFGVVVFNDYRWSPTTSCHQSAVVKVLEALKIKYIKIDFDRWEPQDLIDRGQEVMRQLYQNVVEAQIAVDTSRPNSRAHDSRVYMVKRAQKAFDQIQALDKSLVLSQADKNAIIEKCLDAKVEEVSHQCSESTFKFLSLKRAGLDVAPIAI